MAGRHPSGRASQASPQAPPGLGHSVTIPDAGVYGDCYRACLAHILGLARHEVPHFGASGQNQNECAQMAREWLASRGLTIFECWADEKTKLSTILSAYSRMNPGAPIILHGEATAKGAEINHAVVMLDGAISYDPTGAGICGPAIQVDNGGANWWMEVLVPASAIETRSATDPKGRGPKGESAVAESQTP
jgi:hypothetical protein